MQAKKVKGVGLGNIFGNAPIKLRSSDVRPSIRRHDIPSAEKKDSPELKVCLMQVNNVACLREELCVCCVMFVQWHLVSIIMGNYRTNKPGGAVTQLRPRAVNRQHPVSLLRPTHSLYPAFVNTPCRYALC